MITTLVILFITAALFVWGRFRSDLVAICSTLSLVLLNILTPEEAIAGFANPIVIMMAGLFIVGGGIFSTGLAKMAGSRILGLAGQNETKLFVLLMLTTAFVGAFVSNTGTVALLLPIVVSMAHGAGLSSSRFLMPMAFAGSMGGMLTLIGTPPNLIVRDALVQAGEPALSFFSFTPVGLVCIAVGILVLMPLSRRFLTQEEKEKTIVAGKTLEQLAEEYRVGEGMMQWSVPQGSALVGQTLKELNVGGAYGLNVIEIRRTKQNSGGLLKSVEQIAAADEPLMAGDLVFATGAAQSGLQFAADYGLKAKSLKSSFKRLQFYHVGIAEVLLLPSSAKVGCTIEEIKFRQEYGLNVLGIRRHDKYLLDRLKDRRLAASDVVLVQGPWENIKRLKSNSQSWVVLGQPHLEADRITLDYKAPLAALIMGLMVCAMAFDFIPLAPVTAVVAAAAAMVITGCVRGMEAAYKTINWESIILFAAMLPMSTALTKTGASDAISTSLVTAFGNGSPYMLLAAIYLATSLLTFFISNTVTAVLMAPIALAAATAQGISPTPVLMAVAVSASMCFASPFSTPPNALVMSAGSYRPVHYIKVGLPLQLILAVVMIAVLPLLFPF